MKARVRSAALRAGLVAAALLLAGTGASCRRSSAAPAAVADEASPIVVRDSSEGLLLTWIDEKGDFHIESRVPDVPMTGRDVVRVVDPNKDVGSSPDRIFVVDLRQARPDGTYPVRSMSRADFDALAVARREKSGPTMASAEAPPGPAPGEPAPGGSAPEPAAARPGAGRKLVIIYGASWCEACHQAQAYLRRKGIPYVEKDIEEDPAAAREMQDKLRKNGLRAGSIPVIDVRGQVMVGFSPGAIDAALGASR